MPRGPWQGPRCEGPARRLATPTHPDGSDSGLHFITRDSRDSAGSTGRPRIADSTAALRGPSCVGQADAALGRGQGRVLQDPRIKRGRKRFPAAPGIGGARSRAGARPSRQQWRGGPRGGGETGTAGACEWNSLQCEPWARRGPRGSGDAPASGRPNCSLASRRKWPSGDVEREQEAPRVATGGKFPGQDGDALPEARRAAADPRGAPGLPGRPAARRRARQRSVMRATHPRLGGDAVSGRVTADGRARR